VLSGQADQTNWISDIQLLPIQVVSFPKLITSCLDNSTTRLWSILWWSSASMAREVESYFCISGATFFMEYSTWGTYKLLVEGRGKCLLHLIGPAFEGIHWYTSFSIFFSIYLQLLWLCSNFKLGTRDMEMQLGKSSKGYSCAHKIRDFDVSVPSVDGKCLYWVFLSIWYFCILFL